MGSAAANDCFVKGASVLRIVASKVPAIAALLMVLTVSSSLFAQQPEAVPADKAGWVMGYALTSLAIVLGLVVICRPGNRSSEVKIDDE